jgi:plastocyanin
MAAGIAPGLSAGKPSESTVSRFLNSGNTGTLATSGNLTVKAGTTITWVNQSNNAPHTVTLPIAGQPLQPMSPFSPPSGGTTYDGSHLVNSGPFFPGQKFSLKFTKAGTFKYYCLFHDDQGMEGTITVKS